MTSALRVLVVDDEAPIALAIHDALVCRSHDVTVVGSVEAALEVPEPDVLVSDLSLGGGNGLDLLEELHRRGSAPRTIFITGLPTFEDCRRAMHLGASDFLPKPFELDDLVRAVEDESPVSAQAAHGRSYRRSYDSTPWAVEQGALDIAAYLLRCGVGPATRSRVATACAEVLDNAVTHAYPGTRGQVEVRLEIDEREAVVKIRDSGIGFDAIDANLDQVDVTRDGGFARAASLAEDLRIRSTSSAGTEVWLRFSVYRVHFDEERRLDLSEMDFFTPHTVRMVLETLSDPEIEEPFHLSPALAVTVGRLLAGPDPRRVLQNTLWS